MIRHIILFKLRSAVTSEELDHAIKSICDLKNCLTGILSIVVSECYFQDEKSIQFFSEAVSHVISIDFIDRVALNHFFQSPVSHPAKDAVVNIAEGGYDSIVGFDFVDRYK